MSDKLWIFYYIISSKEFYFWIFGNWVVQENGIKEENDYGTLGFWIYIVWDCDDDDDMKMTYHCPSCNAVVGH